MDCFNKERNSLIRNWVSVQCDSAARWKKYRRLYSELVDNTLKGWFEHTTTVHVLGLTRAAHLAIDTLREHRSVKRFNEGLLMRTIFLHDLGEPFTDDVDYGDKQIHDERKEYDAFRRSIVDLPWFTQGADLEAYLLQFVLKPNVWPILPDDIIPILKDLRDRYKREALIFDYLEREDYILYAHHNYQSTGAPHVLVWTLRHQIPKLDQFVKTAPTFASLLWTSRKRDFYSQFLAENSWVPAEPLASDQKKPPVGIGPEQAQQAS